MVRVADGVLTSERGEADDADVVIAAAPPQVAAAVYGFGTLPPGAIISGRAEAFDRFASLFDLPPKAG